MKNRTSVLAFLCVAGLYSLPSTIAQAVEYTTARPLSQVVTQQARSCGSFSQLPVPMIAWGADEATIAANGAVVTNPPNGKPYSVTVAGSIFANEGLNVKLYRQDDVAEQLRDFLDCKTPFLRMTDGQLAQASDVLSRIPVVVAYKLSDSVGGDVLVVRDHIKDLKDIKKVAMQAYGPHVGYHTTLFQSAGVNLSNVTIVWTKDITEGDRNSQYPAKALREDRSVDAVYVISPDAAELTSGSGENAVRGAKSMISTKSCDTCITDLYIVRKDWADANQTTVTKFVHALMLAQEATSKLVAEKATQKAAFDKLMAASAKMLLDDASKVADAEGMWGDLRMAGWRGNVKFFTDDAWPRNFSRVSKEAGDAMVALGLISRAATFTPFAHDYAALSQGIAGTSAVEASRFNKDAVEKIVRERQQADKLAEGRLFSFEIYFKPGQQNFPADQYGKEFAKVIDLVSTYGGALLTVEGNADTLEYLKRKKGNGTAEELSRMKQGAKNLTLQRANAARDEVIAEAKRKGITLDPNQFATVGNGFMKPNVPGCTYDREGDITLSCAPTSKEQWDAMRRVVFSVVSVEAESASFEVLK